MAELPIQTSLQVGAVGVVPWFAKSVYPVKLVKYNTAEDRLERDANGRCIECKPGEVSSFSVSTYLHPLLNLVSHRWARSLA